MRVPTVDRHSQFNIDPDIERPSAAVLVSESSWRESHARDEEALAGLIAAGKLGPGYWRMESGCPGLGPDRILAAPWEIYYSDGEATMGPVVSGASLDKVLEAVVRWSAEERVAYLERSRVRKQVSVSSLEQRG
jgi:hypothetical protein